MAYETFEQYNGFYIMLDFLNGIHVKETKDGQSLHICKTINQAREYIDNLN